MDIVEKFKDQIISTPNIKMYEKKVVARLASSSDISEMDREYFLPNLDVVVEEKSGIKKLVNKSAFMKMYTPDSVKALKQLNSKGGTTFIEGNVFYATQYVGEDIDGLNSGDWLTSETLINPIVKVYPKRDFERIFVESKVKPNGELFDLRSVNMFSSIRLDNKADYQNDIDVAVEKMKGIKIKAMANKVNLVDSTPTKVQLGP